MSGQDSGFRIQDSGVNLLAARSMAQSSVSKPAEEKALNGAQEAGKSRREAERDKLKKTTQDFEAVFLGMMLKQMRKSLAGQNALFGNSSESKMYQDMMDDATAQHLSKAGTFGLAKVLYKTMEHTIG